MVQQRFFEGKIEKLVWELARFMENVKICYDIRAGDILKLQFI